MPLDPVAWLVMYSEHQTALADLIAANMRHRLPLEAVRDVQPPQQQVWRHLHASLLDAVSLGTVQPVCGG
jgi:hypothetical protein